MKVKKTRALRSFLFTFLLLGAFSASAQPVAVDGRILLAADAGDTSDWVEIAQYDKYSLIVRAKFLNIYPVSPIYGIHTLNDPNYQYTGFGTTADYINAQNSVRWKINAWFNGTAPGVADKLPMDAPLRDYTMQHNAIHTLGTCNAVQSLTNGLSLPYRWQVGIGNDIAFALSWSESANFLSVSQFRRIPVNNSAQVPSSTNAVLNYNKISIPVGWSQVMWLRSPGDIANTAGALGGPNDSRVFQMQLLGNPGRGFIYPALWVNSDILPPP